ncbi:prepilin peptidase [Erythrobacter sp. HKB08]|uniref:A24 family peptidase n=1 Tax=Erythrobacter sp. HKB08 TaxID=2502843 RepID=UPI001008BD51|nr:prepilin peptidase [Erythrobacter sp. HKB08]
MIAGAVLDIRDRRIPNWLSGITLVLGLVFGVLSSEWLIAAGHLGHAVIALLVGMGLFALGMWGGGDGKFYAATAAWFPLLDVFQLVFSISLAGLAVVLGWLGWRRMRGMKASKYDDAGVPYGVAIAAGGAVLFFWRAGLG